MSVSSGKWRCNIPVPGRRYWSPPRVARNDPKHLFKIGDLVWVDQNAGDEPYDPAIGCFGVVVELVRDALAYAGVVYRFEPIRSGYATRGEPERALASQISRAIWTHAGMFVIPKVSRNDDPPWFI